MGIHRAKSQTVRNMFVDQFDGTQIGKGLLFRTTKKGRDEAWGADDNESMTIFYASGLKLREFDEKFGVTGKFTTTTCQSTGKLVSWLEQTSLEVLNARTYGKDVSWIDTTHNATKFMLKTGPPSVVDWGGLTAPAGIFQVPEEEIEVCKLMLARLELNVPGASNNTDGGAAWPAIVLEFAQHHVEDTFHNDKNAGKKLSGLSTIARNQFMEMKYHVLYTVMTEEELSEYFARMRDIIKGHVETRNWINHIEKGKESRTATYTTKFFICSNKGATSRCEVSMSRLKNHGTMKKEMRHFTLPEL